MTTLYDNEKSNVVDLAQIRMQRQEALVDESEMELEDNWNEYSVSCYTEVSEEGVPVESKLKVQSLFEMNDTKLKLYMALIFPGCVVMEWNQCEGYDEF